MRLFGLVFISFVALGAAARAIEVGDVVRLSSMGVGRTVTAISHTDRETAVLTVRAMEANAAEYCERAENLSLDSPKWKTCIQEALTPPTQITVNCRTATIILEGEGGGAYRRARGGTWTSVANPNWVVQGDSVFGLACRRQ